MTRTSHPLPRWIYEPLPVVYVLAGIAAASLGPNLLGFSSGLLLAAVGAAVAVMRVRYRLRAERQALANAPSRLSAPSRMAESIHRARTITPPPMGHRDLDRQHRQLATLSTQLHGALVAGESDADVELKANELVDALLGHLRAEWLALKRLGVRPTREMHDFLRDARRNADGLFAEYHRGALTLEALVGRINAGLAEAHLRMAHPALPSMETALRKLQTPASPG